MLESETSQNVNSLSGKILRLTPDGQVPGQSLSRQTRLYPRNSQHPGFDWINSSTLWVTDHGPSGDLGLYGHDEVNVATAGNNLGWPYGCERAKAPSVPSPTWREAVPPGGAAVYTGNAIPEWKGSLIIGTLRSQHLHRVVLNSLGQLQRHEVYLRGATASDGCGGGDGSRWRTVCDHK